MPANMEMMQTNSKHIQGKPPREMGFTLLELLIVLAIIVMAGSLVIPSITSTESRVFDAQVRQAEAALKYARRIAIARSSPSVATFRFSSPEDAGFEPDSFEEEEGIRNAQPQVRAPAWESEQVRIRFSNTPDQFPEERREVQITFFPQGGSSGGVINFSMNDRNAVIRVDPITGRVSTSYDEEAI